MMTSIAAFVSRPKLVTLELVRNSLERHSPSDWCLGVDYVALGQAMAQDERDIYEKQLDEKLYTH